MKHSERRILTTHVGSLPRSPALRDLLIRYDRGEAVDPALLAREAEAAVRHVVARQIEAGIDVGNDGEQPRESFFSYVQHRLSGFGGRSDRDGKDGVQVHITNTSNLPVEAIEMEYPLRVVSYGLIEESGGAGRYRGGLGLRRVIAPVGHDCVFNGAGERFRNAPWGVFGGGPGAMGRFLHIDAAGREKALDIKPSGIVVKAGERILVETPGAGGYGPPAERDPAALEEDRRSGKFGAAWIKERYGR